MSQLLDNIRKSDNSIKFRYLVICSGLVGIVAVTIWALSLRSALEKINQPQSLTDAASSTTTFLGTISSAWNVIKDRTINTFQFFKEKSSQTNEITVQNSQ